jgi:hypothetical protein
MDVYTKAYRDVILCMIGEAIDRPSFPGPHPFILTFVSPVAISPKAWKISSRTCVPSKFQSGVNVPPFLGRSFSIDTLPRLCAPVTRRAFLLHCSEILDYRHVRRYLSESGYEWKTDDIQVYGRTARLVSLWVPVSISRNQAQ